MRNSIVRHLMVACLLAFVGTAANAASYTNEVTDSISKAQKEAAKAAAKAKSDAAKAEAKAKADADKAKADADKAARAKAEAERKANQAAAKEKDNSRERDRKARTASIKDSLRTQADNARKEARQKAEDQMKAEKERIKQDQQRDKAHQDSIRQLRKGEAAADKRQSELQDSLRREQLKAQREQRKLSRDSLKSVMSKFDSLRHERGSIDVDSIKWLAKMAGMPMPLYHKWSKYYQKPVIDQVLEGINDSIYLLPVNPKFVGQTKKTKSMDLENKRLDRMNYDRMFAVEQYKAYKRVLDSLLQRRYSQDSVKVANNKRYQFKNQYDILQKRHQAREKRIWKDLDFLRRQDKLNEPLSDLTEIVNTDSIYSVWEDSLSVPFAQRFSYRTNAVSWLLGVINAGVEFDLSNKPKSNKSIMLDVSYKPNTNFGGRRERIAFNIISVAGEFRHYWRVGGKQTIQGMLNNIDYEGKPGFHEFKTYTYKTDSLKRGAHTPDYHAIAPSVEHLKKDTANHGRLKVVTRDDTLASASFLRRYLEPFRYNKLSGRYVKKPYTKNAYYVGVRAGYERYLWMLNSTGRKGQDVYLAVTGGFVRNIARFKNGAYLDLDFGLAVGAQVENYQKGSYSWETGNFKNAEYIWEASTGTRVTPYPVLKDIHVSLIYSMRGIKNKVSNIFATRAFEEKIEDIKALHDEAKEKRTHSYTLKHKKRAMAYQSSLNQRQESDNAKAKRVADKKEREKQDSIMRAQKKLQDSIWKAEDKAYEQERVARKKAEQEKASAAKDKLAEEKAALKAKKEEQDAAARAKKAEGIAAEKSKKDADAAAAKAKKEAEAAETKAKKEADAAAAKAKKEADAAAAKAKKEAEKAKKQASNK